MTLRIIIVGAGPSGLAALQTFLSTPEVQQGLWTPTVFEASSDLGGVWHTESITGTSSSPVYEGLTTNLPHLVMGFPSFSFPPSTPLFPGADTVQRYLQSYADRFNLREHITFNARVENVVWDHIKREWHVTVNGIEEIQTCSLLLVCNGHHNAARMPPLSGLSTLLSSGHASHSQMYRSPSLLSRTLESLPTPLFLEESKILIVGSGPSGQDISSALASHAKCVLLSTSKPLQSPPHSNITLKSRTTHFVNRKAFFSDGSSEDINYVILATGYRLSFPFLPTSSTSTYPNSFTISTTTPMPMSLPPNPQSILSHLTITPQSSTLFPLARHLFGLPSCGFSAQSSLSSTLPPPTSIAFLGLLVRVAPLPIVEAQARAIVAVFRASLTANHTTEKKEIDWTREHDLIRARHHLLCSSFTSSSTPEQEREKELQTYLSASWDIFSDPIAQFTYRDSLDDLCHSLSSSSIKNQDSTRVRVKPWETHFYLHKDALRQSWRLLEERGLAEEWVRGVGAGKTEEEWVGLMDRVLAYWEEETQGSE